MTSVYYSGVHLIAGATGAVGDTGLPGVQGDIGLLRFGLFS